MRLRIDDLTQLHAPDRLEYDTLIDVRACAEFAHDHLPGAINLPVLDDAERAQVGRVYVQHSRFEARRIGAAMVARNAARMLEGPLAAYPRDWRPVVYCWRGGQRSGSLALILQQVGWPVRVIEGGYRAYRRLVVRALYDDPFPAPVIVLDGDTGTAKTALLQLLAARGVQVLDLEAMARHRGSLFGRQPRGQPSQKGFESALAMGVAGLDPSRPVVVEGESHRIGRIMLPPALWSAMQTAPRVLVQAPLSARAAYLARVYADIAADPEALATRIEALRPWHSRDRIAEWTAQARAGAVAELAGGLLAQHYDPRYRRARRSVTAGRCLDLPDLQPQTLARAATEIADNLQAISQVVD
ncbi:tRNA 2-selenouridine(34) synthase MnmH [Rhodobacteraceae bacterium 2376]|uniref:tRNA 2-selenouridine(34) synthase MnmH n=1 Tax=Rhabdonatronobacter sediminivivens TaxID=2743469 RepID=A0A7Z0L263_9RHOB|nr:tRNA 2-selenouridine(34) synthase MnmH [Rhabdonatronobacter sediminivivens]NYS26288.1 tRNA 2-selenouridine(34) synthase MnmH [Rhabdonatronobacter sediminivivens]